MVTEQRKHQLTSQVQRSKRECQTCLMVRVLEQPSANMHYRFIALYDKRRLSVHILEVPLHVVWQHQSVLPFTLLYDADTAVCVAGCALLL